MEISRIKIPAIKNVTPKLFQECHDYKSFGMSCSNLSPLKQDTVSFKGNVLKKSDFKGSDLVVIERYKPNIQQFKSKEDLQTFAESKINELKEKDFDGRQEETTVQRKAMLKEWFDYVIKENDAYSNTQRLIILSAITKDLKPSNDAIPPVLNKGTLAQTVTELEEKLKVNPKENFDFNKMYQNNLRTSLMKDSSTGETMTGWVVIPSKKHDSKNFKKNVEKLKTLSHKSWCTKSFNAEPYLREGDFHVYLENGQPKLGVRFVGNKVAEIQGENNNGKIPIKYYDKLTEHINKEHIKLTEKASNQINNCEYTKLLCEENKKKLEPYIKNNDVKKIFEHFGISVEENENDLLTIRYYPRYFNEEISLEDMGIDENKLFEKIEKVNRTLDLTNSKITSLGALKAVEGDLILPKNTTIKDWKNLKYIKGNLIAHDKDLYKKIIKNLEIIENFNIKNLKQKFKDSNYDQQKIFDFFGITTKKDEDGFLTLSHYSVPNGALNFEILGIDEEKLFENVKHIEGTADLQETSLKSLKNLESIGGNLYLGENVTSLGNLQYVGGIADLSNSKVESLNNLAEVKRRLHLSSSNVKDLGQLEHVGESLHIQNTNLKNLGKLKYVGDAIYYRNSGFNFTDFLHIKRDESSLKRLFKKLINYQYEII